MHAMYTLAWLREGAAPVRVNWRDMQTEELGSVYEGLLELVPRLAADGRAISFAEDGETKGNDRKTSGSYYTPDSLVQTLLDSALDPVLDRLESEAAIAANGDPAANLLTITVLDPACGSGHFLLAAARRIAERVARLRGHGLSTQEERRHALRDVVRFCIHGVDRNPMAVELAKVALWIETVDPGKPLGFLDANLRCGDSLLGVYSLEALRAGIPDAAYKPLAGDDKAVAKIFAARNKDDLKGQARLDFSGRPTTLPFPPALADLSLALRSLPEESELDVEARARAYEQIRNNPELTRWFDAADLYIAAFLAPKARPLAGSHVQNQEFPGMPLVPVSSHVWRKVTGGQVYGPLLGVAQDLASRARAFHWPLEFPHILMTRDAARRGFDVVLGNPPWERIKLQEQEFFAAREPAIAEAANAAARGRLIVALRAAEPGSRERLLHEEFEGAKRVAEAASVFARVPAIDQGRFPLAGRGDVNTYALFAELFSELVSERGRAGVIVPTGIATDATTQYFFGSLVAENRLIRLLSLNEVRAWFPDTDDRKAFCLLTLGEAVTSPKFTFAISDLKQLQESARTFSLSPAQIATINPNTKTAPMFRSIADAELTAGIYERLPVLINDTKGEAGNPWGLSFTRLFDMSNDSGLFRTASDFASDGHAERQGNRWLVPEGAAAGLYLPLYEAKLIHQFDHRWATYDSLDSRDVTPVEKRDASFEVTPRYWVHEDEITARLAASSCRRDWLTGFRDVCRSTDERTVIASVLPRSGVNHKLPLFSLPLQQMAGCLAPCLRI
jgi:hypothetical protein